MNKEEMERWMKNNYDHICTWNSYNNKGKLCCSICGKSHNRYLMELKEE